MDRKIGSLGDHFGAFWGPFGSFSVRLRVFLCEGEVREPRLVQIVPGRMPGFDAQAKATAFPYVAS